VAERNAAGLPGPPSTARRIWAQLRLSTSFYLGIGAPSMRRAYPGCRVRAAAGYTTDLVRRVVEFYRGGAAAAGDRVEEINFRSAAVTLADTDKRFFVKQLARRHLLHDVERSLGCSRADRAWRAAHLLPRLGVLTPRAVGTALAETEGENRIEYVITEWLDGAIPYHERLRAAATGIARLRLLREFAGRVRRWNDRGIYLRDLVTNVLTRETPEGLEYWLTDLDQFHPLRRLTRRRLLHQMAQFARWSGPLNTQEAAEIAASYLGARSHSARETIEQVLLTTPPAE